MRSSMSRWRRTLVLAGACATSSALTLPNIFGQPRTRARALAYAKKAVLKNDVQDDNASFRKAATLKVSRRGRADMVLLPTPPLPESTSTLRFTPESRWRMMARSGSSSRPLPSAHAFWLGHPSQDEALPACSDAGPTHVSFACASSTEEDME